MIAVHAGRRQNSAQQSLEAQRDMATVDMLAWRAAELRPRECICMYAVP